MRMRVMYTCKAHGGGDGGGKIARRASERVEGRPRREGNELASYPAVVTYIPPLESETAASAPYTRQHQRAL